MIFVKMFYRCKLSFYRNLLYITSDYRNFLSITEELAKRVTEIEEQLDQVIMDFK